MWMSVGYALSLLILSWLKCGQYSYDTNFDHSQILNKRSLLASSICSKVSYYENPTDYSDNVQALTQIFAGLGKQINF